jgi:hypothetical protein
MRSLSYSHREALLGTQADAKAAQRHWAKPAGLWKLEKLEVSCDGRITRARCGKRSTNLCQVHIDNPNLDI